MPSPLIKDIEIHYFRSIYNGSMRGCGELNVIVGNNDAGKSNVLRALNLFFNEESDSPINVYGEDLGHDYGEREWGIDFSQARAEESKIGKKKRYIRIKITFNRPETYTSLPETFSLTKQWGINYDDYKINYSVGKKQERFVNGLLNKIRVHYIPAIKHRGIFGHYLRLLHDVLIDSNPAIKEAFNALQPTIQNATDEMSAEIQRTLSLRSRISFPSDLSDIFGNLDFLTKAESSQDSVSLLQRGDGIQTRHLPHILDFIAKKDTGHHHIWLYEEPEASLELAQAFDLARLFSDNFSKRNQIYITTHSPAFYSLTKSNVVKYQVQKADKQIRNDLFSISNIHGFASLGEIDDSLGLTKLVSERARKIYEQLETTEKKLNELKNKHQPLIICEGKTDIQYVKKAIELSDYPDAAKQCYFFDAGGCTNIKKIIKDYNEKPQLYQNRAFCIFDCDVPAPPTSKNKNKLFVFKFTKCENNPMDKGIENLLPLEIVNLIKTAKNGDDPHKFYKNIKCKKEDDLFETVNKQSLDKDRLANFVCNRNRKEDFISFRPLIEAITDFLTNPG